MAPKNESYVINVLKFLGIIDEEGTKVQEKATTFLHHENSSFASALETIVRDAYSELFELHGDSVWTLEKAVLTQFFRTTDNSSDVVGQRQASTFMCLAGLAGHSDLPPTRETTGKKAAGKVSGNSDSKRAAAKSQKQNGTIRQPPNGRSVGLTVRVEVNLPADGSQETYDMIFRSIRENLINES